MMIWTLLEYCSTYDPMASRNCVSGSRLGEGGEGRGRGEEEVREGGTKQGGPWARGVGLEVGGWRLPRTRPLQRRVGHHFPILGDVDPGYVPNGPNPPEDFGSRRPLPCAV